MTNHTIYLHLLGACSLGGILCINSSAEAATGGQVVYNAIDYIDVANDCTGTGASQMCDLYPAIDQAMDLCEADPPRNHEQVGCTIVLPQGDYTMSQTPVLCRAHTIQGQGGGGDGYRTWIKSDANVGCFRVAGYGECAQTSMPGTASGSGARLEGFACEGDVATATGLVSGIEIEADVNIENVMVRYYVQGVRISADVTRTPATNANTFRLVDVRSFNNEHAAVYIQGGDTNAYYADSIDAIDNCRNQSKWDASLGDCSAIIDHSFLGGTMVATHVAATSGAPGYHIGNGNNQQSTFINPYLEAGAGSGHLAGNSVIFGTITNGQPIADNVNGGLEANGRRFNRLQIENYSDSSNRVYLRLGDWGIAGTVLSAYSVDTGTGYPIHLRSSLETATQPAKWGFRLRPSEDSLSFQMRHTTSGGAGVTWGAQFLPQLGGTNLRTGPQGLTDWCPWNTDNQCP